jgi:hypothetical protein
MNNYIIIDNFFKNPDVVRERALSKEYIKSSKKTGWKGYRTNINDVELVNYIKNKLIEIDDKFKNLVINEIYFHYSLESTKDELNGNFAKNRLHRDETEWAGVVYLTPKPNKNSGTTIYNDNTNLEDIIDNVYNRYVFYDGKKLHGPQDTFGDSIENARFTLTIFANISKNKKTII